MNEKVKLPKFMCNWLKGFEKGYPLNVITKVDRLRSLGCIEVSHWLSADEDNQWLLIDALRYGYEAEPEPRWGIKAGNCYMTNPDNYGFDDVTPETAIENDAYWAIKSYADDIVKTLGFGEVVDLNKEGEADD
ncbi:hypothetical protein NON14_08195 [Latilactobacillus sakei]|uniref:hypothetical protein n=1 Tax=Latilactobacillus sakei TaxID=1599 RepID=UPI0038F5ED86